MLPPRLPISKELAVVLGALLLLLFASPVADWWAHTRFGWLTPYGLWLLVILGALLIHRRNDPDEP
ncbi:MAG: UTP--glucose-1-phosphate uridylyltransferase [Chromatiaceae bacterium]|nr:UTP--glucose-1-phosphate uridylyltransferase [Gammaproteobacteria bacterium]MCP5304336.1 UTP--glucose-1-phosphate uridylyltransferase [Chromatiaceae bacterium]MCP5314061.1 UTP--glucose-1-phosphate uridylyltransferase [Chromatiaceae bacterium]